MTDYPSGRHNHNKSSWKEATARRKMRDLFAVLVVGFLALLIVSGLLRALALKAQASKSVWSPQNSIAVAVNLQMPAVVVFQKEPPRVTFFSMPTGISYATGESQKPVEQVVSVFKMPGQDATHLLTNLMGINVANYFYFKTPPKVDQNNYQEIFKNFASIQTPIGILFGRTGSVGQTNLTGEDLLHLWWQVKGLSMRQVDFVSLQTYAEDMMGPGNTSFKGIDREKTTTAIGKYFTPLSAREHKITIRNAAGVSGAARLARQLVETYGWTVDMVEDGEQESVSHIISREKNQESRDLAKIFGCDIVQVQNDQDTKITIILGSDFAKKFF
ncbi:LytR C-terminal domain-containing protein [Candidatus Curtissbacteria bacterium]|nr:LytR C-terminal domain-containing protein [Candidatus Curtissbacteria bacterium]